MTREQFETQDPRLFCLYLAADFNDARRTGNTDKQSRILSALDSEARRAFILAAAALHAMEPDYKAAFIAAAAPILYKELKGE